MKTLLQLLLASFALALFSIPAHAEVRKIDLNSLPAYQFPPERVCLSNCGIGSLPGAGQPDGQEQDRQGGLDSGHFCAFSFHADFFLPAIPAEPQVALDA